MHIIYIKSSACGCVKKLVDNNETEKKAESRSKS